MGDKLRGGTTIGGQLAWHAGNMGAGSNLDADKLDGQEGSYYATAASVAALAALNTTVNLTGNQTIADVKTFSSTISGNITGNASTATTLQTARTINGVSFNGSANINIEDRLGTPIASAATTTVGTTGLGDYIHITGTTTITSLGTAGATGIRRTLIFDGALTLTHNATSLICPGAANITTVAGTVIEVISETTANWRVISVTHPSIDFTELGYLNGVTSAIQTQFSGKANTSHTHAATDITSGTLSVARGGTGVSTSTGTGNVVLNTSPTLTTPILGIASATSIDLANSGISSGTITLATVTSTSLTIGDKTVSGSIELTIQATQGVNRQLSKMLITHDGTTAIFSEYGFLNIGSTLATYSAAISGNNINLLITGTSATSTVYKIMITNIDI